MDAQMLNEALIRQYPPPQSATESLDQHSILILLFELQRHGIKHDSVLDALENKNLCPSDHAIIAFLDKYLVTPIAAAELRAPTSSKLQGVAVAAMRIALSDGILAMTKGPIIPIADSLLALTFGLSDLQGKPYKTLEDKFLEALQSLHLATENLVSDQEMIGARNRLLQLLEADIIGFVSGERDKTKIFERRLVESFSAQINENKSRILATKLLNEQMENMVIPQLIFDFLRGVWLDSLQLIATQQGEHSEQWQRAIQLTETLISTVQPTQSSEETKSDFDKMLEEVTLDVELEVNLKDEPQNDPPPEEESVLTETVSTKTDPQLKRIIEQLPAELKSSLVSIEHDNAAIATALDNIESVHANIMEGKLIEGCEFSLLPLGSDTVDADSHASQSLLAPVKKISVNNWFVFHEDNGNTRHIKLTLKDDDSQYLIFTNRGGSSTLQISFEEFAHLLSSGKVTQLPKPGRLLKNIRRNLMASLKLKAKEDQA